MGTIVLPVVLLTVRALARVVVRRPHSQRKRL